MLLLAEPASTVVRERWARVARLGVTRDSAAYPEGASGAELVERQERLADILREAETICEAITTELRTGPRVVILADGEGVVLASRADREKVDPLTRVRLVAGARWDEKTRGTNAIGTALIEGAPVAVIGRAHYEVRNRELFCYATPLRDAYGDVVAVLDLSGPLSQHDPEVATAVQGAGAMLERALRAVAYGDAAGGALRTIERLVAGAAGPAMLVEAGGTVRVINGAAHRALALPDEVRLTCENVFGVPFGELVSAASARGGMRFEAGTGGFQVEMDPIVGRGRRTLAVVVHFEKVRVTAQSPRSAPFPEMAAILGEDPALVAAKQRAALLATTPLPVLLLAETGTGKELFARAIHAASSRRGRSFVAVNCGALSPSLIASELFGYAPGAFTGAGRSGSDGRIGAANGGTLFLDEIAEMPESLQAALLRVLDDGVYQRVGEARERQADFRLVCATCRDLSAMVADGRFRKDLFYRIFGATLTIPALRDRSDRVFLAERFLERAAAGACLAPDATAWIVEHDWPGNVRELKGAMTYAAALAEGSVVRREHLPRPVLASPASHPRDVPATRREILREAIGTTLHACAGNVSEAARRLGVGRGTIYRALRERNEDPGPQG